jgi:hypothetical protein
MKSEVSREEVLRMMAGQEELDVLESELKEFARADSSKGSGLEAAAAAERALAEALHKESDRLKGD